MPTERQQEIDAAVAAYIDAHPHAGYREIASAVGIGTAQVAPSLTRLGLPTSARERATLPGIATGWDAAARFAGNREA